MRPHDFSSGCLPLLDVVPSHELELPNVAVPRAVAWLVALPALLLGCITVSGIFLQLSTDISMFMVPSASHTIPSAQYPLMSTPRTLHKPLQAEYRFGGSAWRRRDVVDTPRRMRDPPPEDDWEDPEENLGEPLPPTTRPDLKTLTDPNINPKVVDAVDRLGGRVTVADVATAAGVDLATASGAVRDMAYLTGAGILVTEKGDLLYDFGPGVKSRLAASSLRAAVNQAVEKAAPFLQKAVRVSFGIALFASLAIIFTSITLLQSSSSNSRDDDRGDRGGGGQLFFGPRMFWGPDIWIIPDPYYGYGYRPPRKEMSFIESVYSFVFGDGDPNYNLEERRYRQIAQLIRDNNGAVVAEQLAPYLDPPKSWFDRNDTYVVDEAFVQPVLTRFNGRAEVTPNGDIVYVFDELRPTTAQRRPTALLSAALEEKEVQFSRASGLNLALAGGLGALNLFGAIQLGTLFNSISAARALGPYLDTVRAFYPLLLVYALVYVATPLWRWFRLQIVNTGIEQRNANRAEAALEIATPTATLVKKLQGAREYQKAEQRISSKDVIYRSDRETPPPAADPFADFDRKLQGRK